jgi:hypothetical protein
MSDEINDDSFVITKENIEFYNKYGFIKLKNVFSKETLEIYKKEISELVYKLNKMNKPFNERTTYEKAFLQLINLYQHNKKVEEFVFSKRLGKIASELMQVEGVRLYHDQALYKE